MNNMERIHFINFVSTLSYGSKTRAFLINLYDDIYNKLNSNTKYEHPTDPGWKHIPTGGSDGQILVWKSDGEAQWGGDKNTTYGLASSDVAGLVKIGYKSSDKNYAVQLQDGKMFVNVPWINTTYNQVTTESDGLMSKEDKIKLNNIENNANNYTHPSGNGNNHIPSDGNAGQILVWSSNGTAKWSSPSVASATTYGVVKQIPKMEVPAEATLESYGTFLTTFIDNLKNAGIMANE